MKRAFTLVEVAVAGSLIGICILSAALVIPQGLKAQNMARMRAVAAATVMYLSAKNANPPSFGISIADNPANVQLLSAVDIYATFPNVNSSLSTYYQTAPLTDIIYRSSGTVAQAPDKLNLYVLNPLPQIGNLARRLAFSYNDGNNGSAGPTNTRAITAWLLSTDPDTPAPAVYRASNKSGMPWYPPPLTAGDVYLLPLTAQYLCTFTEYRP